MLTKKEKFLIEQLERIFPKLVMIFPGEEYNNGKDYEPEYTLDWNGFITTLKLHGFQIDFTKEQKNERYN